MKTKFSNAPLDVPKIAEQLEEYENSSAPGRLEINMPLPDALRAIVKAKPAPKGHKDSSRSQGILGFPFHPTHKLN